MSSTNDNDHERHINTQGGSYVEGGVQTGGGDFVGRDKHVHGDEVHGDKIIRYEGPAYSRLNYRAESDYLVTYLTKRFVGRTDDLRVAAEFAAEATPGYLLLEAPAGFGKSAITAQLIHQQEQRAWPHTVVPHMLYFFIRRQRQQHTATAFLRALNSQLLDLLQRPGGVPPDLGSLQSQFSEFWNRAITQASETHPLLLVIDGLDEMQTEQGETSIAQILPSNLAPYVHVLVSSRPRPDPLDHIPLEHPFRSARVHRLKRFGDADIRELLQLHGASSDVVARLRTRVLKMTNGEPLFARFVCQDVARGGEEALARLEQEPPRDVEEYFHQQFQQLDQLVSGDLAWSILGLLTIALGGMTMEEIAEVLGQGKRQVRKALEPIGRFLIGEPRLELMHLQLRKVLAEEFSEAEQTALRDKLFAWFERYKAQHWPGATPHYILDHFARHMQTVGSREELNALFADQHWMWVRVPQRAYTYDGYLVDLEAAWAQADRDAREQIDAGEMPTAFADCFRYALIHTSVNSIAEAYVPELVKRAVETERWPTERAMSVAARVPNAEDRAWLCAEILHMGHATLEQNARLLSIGLSAALAIADESARAQALAALIPQLPAEQQSAILQRVIDATLAIANDGRRVEALAALVPQLPAEQQPAILQHALDAALAIDDDWLRGDALAALAPLLTGAPLARALDAALATRDEWGRAEVLASLAPQLTGAPLARALDAALAIGDEWWRTRALAALVPQLPAEQQPAILQHALNAALAIDDERRRANALAALAPQLTGAPLTRALDAALALADESGRARALTTLAPHLPPEQQAAILQHTLDATLAIADERERGEALTALAHHLPHNLLTRALDTALNMADERLRAHVLAAFAPQLPGELVTRVLDAALIFAPGLARAKALRALTSKVATSPFLLRTIRQDIVGYMWNLREDLRSNVLALCEPASPIMPPVLSSEILSVMAEDIIDVCEHWRWL